jgi:acyl-CoA reductase-like NAD-dependent aldehyde dehydrogenase
LCCEAFVALLYEAGLPEDWCRFVPCELDVAEKLVTDPRVAFFSFIGSAKVGWMLRSKLANGTRCALEHGGAAPVIVDQHVNVETMIPKLVKGGFYHSGQVCVSVQRVFVPSADAHDIAALIASKAAALHVGNAILETTECGPLIRPREVDRVASWVKEAVAEGATLMTGGTQLGATTYAPTVLLNPSVQSKVSSAEIFGPVVCVYGYDDVRSAIAQANSLPFAFQASVFTNRLDFAMSAFESLDASAVMINEHTAFRVDWMPFAGRRQSGYGIGGIGHTMQDMTAEKMMVMTMR